MKNNKIYFISLGCPRNLVDSEIILSKITEKGYSLTDNISDADFIIINTCSFLKAARDEAMDCFEEVFLNKKPSSKVIATGCMVQSHKDILEKKFKDIHCYLGAGDIDKILLSFEEDKKEIISNKKSYIPSTFEKRMQITLNHYAYIKIAEGCRKNCSYCLIPKIKGPLISKSQENIEKEFDYLLSKGVFEIILIAQDLTDYGKDRSDKRALEKLIKALLSRKQNFWLRLMYVYPDDISDELIEIMKSDKRLCPYVDMPIQHINDEILSSMRRSVNKKKIINTIERFKENIPNIAIRTSIIVGYPNETDEQFNELLSFVSDYKLDHVGIFQYSREKNTSAYDLKNQIPEKIKQKRFNILASKQKEIINDINKSLINKEVEAIIDSYHPESNLLLIARSQRQAPDIDNVIIINNIEKASYFGSLCKVKISDSSDIDLVGSIV